jgi:hypothetical protein
VGKRWQWLVMTAALAAQGCATNAVEPIPQEGAMSRKITWIIAEDPHETCQKVGGKVLMFKTSGCAEWRDPNNCVIYTRAPKSAEDRRTMETMGHEMLHCFAGHFHPRLN